MLVDLHKSIFHLNSLINKQIISYLRWISAPRSPSVGCQGLRIRSPLENVPGNDPGLLRRPAALGDLPGGTTQRGHRGTPSPNRSGIKNVLFLKD